MVGRSHLVLRVLARDAADLGPELERELVALGQREQVNGWDRSDFDGLCTRRHRWCVLSSLNVPKYTVGYVLAKIQPPRSGTF